MTTEKPYTIVTADAHVGPLLEEQLREYCPSRYLSAFDDYVAQDQRYRAGQKEAMPEEFREDESGELVRNFRNASIPGHYDVYARLRDMDYDGVAAEIVFHGSANDEPIPFHNMSNPKVAGNFKNTAPHDPELAALGRHIYNQWLADFCSVEPERHLGLVQLPIWDVEASVRELQWARSVGLRGMNFPSPQSWLAQYNSPVWEPLWVAAEELDMTLAMHNGTGSDADYSGVDGLACYIFEGSVLFGQRILPWMIYGGVFERHPKLKLVVTETHGYWWQTLLADLDSNYNWNHNLPTRKGGRPAKSYLRDLCPRLPSEYCKAHVFAGASFMNHIEAESASRDGSYPNFLWGSDYPHAEGTFSVPRDRSETPMTKLALRFAFNGIPEAHTRAMLGENAIGVYGLDAAKLETVAARIGAPTPSEINEPIAVPEGDHVTSQAFRQHGMFD